MTKMMKKSGVGGGIEKEKKGGGNEMEEVKNLICLRNARERESLSERRVKLKDEFVFVRL